MPSIKQGGVKYHFFESLVWLDLGLNPSLPNYWRTLYSLGELPGFKPMAQLSRVEQKSLVMVYNQAY